MSLDTNSYMQQRWKSRRKYLIHASCCWQVKCDDDNFVMWQIGKPANGTGLLDLTLTTAEEGWQLWLGKAIWKIVIMQWKRSEFQMLAHGGRAGQREQASGSLYHRTGKHTNGTLVRKGDRGLLVIWNKQVQRGKANSFH